MIFVIKCEKQLLERKFGNVFEKFFNGFIKSYVREEAFCIKTCHDTVSVKINNFDWKQKWTMDGKFADS